MIPLERFFFQLGSHEWGEWAEDALRFETVAEVQDYIDRFFDRLTSEWLARGFKNPIRLKYALSESVMNAWMHGNRCDPARKVVVRHGYVSETFILEVIDEGEGFDVETVPDPGEGDNVYRDCGRGIWLIRHFTDSVTWSGNRLRMAFGKALMEPGLS
ncbi:MAG: ATP-binding protein [Acidobacteriota bacterium]